MSEINQFIESIERGMSVRESLQSNSENADKVKKLGKQFMDELDKFTNAAYKLVDLWYALEDEWPDFANLGAKDYPFEKSFDELTNDIIAWKNSVKSGLMGE